MSPFFTPEIGRTHFGFREKRRHNQVTPLAVAGMLLIAGSLFLLSETQVFPGIRALPPTIGAALLILAGHRHDNWVSRLLALKPLVVVGLVSYSAYLWHWPLLAFFRYGYGEIGGLAGTALFILTMLLAWLSYVYIEQPVRRSSAPALQTIMRQYVLPAGALGLLSLACIYPDRFGIRLYSSEYLGRLAKAQNQTRPAYQFNYVCQRQKLSDEDLVNAQCIVGANSAAPPKAILWGDSNAAHYIGMLGTFAQTMGFRFRNVEVGACPPVDIDPKPFVEADRESDCRASLVMVRPLINEFPVVIISASWSVYQARSPAFLQSFFATATAMARKGKLVILIGKVPEIPGYDRLSSVKALSYPFLDYPYDSSVLARDRADVNASLRKFAEETDNVEYFEITSYLCPKGICSAFAPDGKPLYYDKSHLTMAASWRIGRDIIQNEGVPTPFTLVADWPRAKIDIVK